jgi:adenylate cyclase
MDTSKESIQKQFMNKVWYWYLTGEEQPGMPPSFAWYMLLQPALYRLLPGAPRCFDCNVPLSGLGGVAVKVMGIRPSVFSPLLCNTCEQWVRKAEGGAEVELTLLFADVRGSTPLAEKMPAAEYSQLIQKFYKVTTDVLVHHNAMVNRLMGDQVSALFVPRFAGRDHAGVAVQAARELLRVTGHEDRGGPWIPVGVGVHTGPAYVGVVGSKDSVNEIAVLGNAANLTARLSSRAAGGEVLVSEVSAAAAGLGQSGFEKKVFQLKGISEPVPVRVIRMQPA